MILFSRTYVIVHRKTSRTFDAYLKLEETFNKNRFDNFVTWTNDMHEATIMSWFRAKLLLMQLSFSPSLTEYLSIDNTRKIRGKLSGEKFGF